MVVVSGFLNLDSGEIRADVELMKMWFLKSYRCPETSSLNINFQDSWDLVLTMKKGLKQCTDLEGRLPKSNSLISVA